MSDASYSAVWLDGRFVSQSEARIPLAQPGYLLGEGAFATLRGYDGVCFRAERHFAQLVRGAKLFGIELPIELEHLRAIVDEAAALTKSRDAYVRVTLTRGEHAPILSVLSRPMDVPTDDDYAQGIAATIVTARHVPPACIDTTVKLTSYAPQVLARREVAARGAKEGIMLAIDGSLASGTMSNIFLVEGDRLLTPSLESGCRAGVTREAVLEIAASVGLRAEETRLEVDALYAADEAFFSSTRIECLPLATVDARPIQRRSGFERTAKLRVKLVDLITKETSRKS